MQTLRRTAARINSNRIANPRLQAALVAARLRAIAPIPAGDRPLRITEIEKGGQRCHLAKLPFGSGILKPLVFEKIFIDDTS
jgi:hypothetical protein